MIHKIELILTIVTTMALAFLSMAIIVLGIIKIQDNQVKQEPTCQTQTYTKPV